MESNEYQAILLGVSNKKRSKAMNNISGGSEVRTQNPVKRDSLFYFFYSDFFFYYLVDFFLIL